MSFFSLIIFHFSIIKYKYFPSVSFSTNQDIQIANYVRLGAIVFSGLCLSYSLVIVGQTINWGGYENLTNSGTRFDLISLIFSTIGTGLFVTSRYLDSAIIKEIKQYDEFLELTEKEFTDKIKNEDLLNDLARSKTKKLAEDVAMKERELEKVTAESFSLSQQDERLKNKLKSMRESIKRVSDTTNRLKSDIEDGKETMKTEESMFDLITIENNKFEAELSKVNDELRKSEERLRPLIEKRDMKKSELNTAKKKIQTAKSNIKNGKKEINKLTQSLNALKQNSEQLEEEKTNLSLQSQKIIEDSKKTKSDITKQEREISKMKESLRKSEEKLRPLLEEKKKKDGEFSTSKKELEDIQANNTRMTKEIELLTESLAELKQSSQKLDEEKLSLSSEHQKIVQNSKKAETDIIEIEKEISQIKDDLHNEEDKLSPLTKDRDNKQAELEVAKGHLQELKDNKRKTKAELDKLTKSWRKVKQSANQVEREHAAIISENEKIAQDKITMETKIKSGKVANIKLKNKLRKNKHKLGPIIEEKDDTEAEHKILTELNENVKKLTFPNSERVDHMDFEELQKWCYHFGIQDTTILGLKKSLKKKLNMNKSKQTPLGEIKIDFLLACNIEGHGDYEHVFHMKDWAAEELQKKLGSMCGYVQGSGVKCGGKIVTRITER